MPRVGVLTLYPHMYNYGGFLQEMALQDVVSNLGVQCEIINYSPANEYNTFSAKRNIKYITISKVLGKIRREFRGRVVPGDVKEFTGTRQRAFDVYRKNNLRLSGALNYEELRAGTLPYDAVICGSDQIWNPDYNIPAFFLDFAREDQKKIIYGASLGKTSLTKVQLDVYSSLMKNPDYISVREKSAKDLLEPIAPKSIEVVLDPTLLHDRVYWEKKAKESTKDYSNYVFCYFLDLTKEKVKAARNYAQKHNCKTIIVPYLHGYNEPLCEKLADIMDSNVNPADFLKLILNAECVLTDSFHASVFSLIFEKKFWVFGRKAGNYNMNTRIDTLLSYFNAEDRMIEPDALENQEDRPLVVSYEKLDAMKEQSYRFLREALSGEST